MAYTNSKLISYTKLSPNHSGSVLIVSTASPRTAWWVSCQLEHLRMLYQSFQTGKLQLWHWQGRSHLSLRGGKEPQLVFFFQRQ